MTKKFKYEERLGLPLEFIDCSRKKNYEKFEKTIKKSKIIWVMGGDTLYLLYHLKKSGFINLLKKRIMNDNIIFVGCCAGAIISGKSINPVFIDRATRKKTKYYLKNTYKKKFWQKKNNIKCLNLVKNLDVVPHCDHRNKKKISTLKKHKMYCLPERKQLIL
jgi:peptidase E